MSFEIKCPHCNKTLIAENDWLGLEAECQECGHSLIISKEENQQEVYNQSDAQENLHHATRLPKGNIPKKKKKRKTALVCIVGIMLLVIISVIVFLSSSSKKSEKNSNLNKKQLDVNVPVKKETELKKTESHDKPAGGSTEVTAVKKETQTKISKSQKLPKWWICGVHIVMAQVPKGTMYAFNFQIASMDRKLIEGLKEDSYELDNDNDKDSLICVLPKKKTSPGDMLFTRTILTATTCKSDKFKDMNFKIRLKGDSDWIAPLDFIEFNQETHEYKITICPKCGAFLKDKSSQCPGCNAVINHLNKAVEKEGGS
ncbi:MAG: hypothetical protein WCS27_13035 [Victivallaceae bacterium]